MNTIKLDKRYTYALKWCGYVSPLYCAAVSYKPLLRGFLLCAASVFAVAL